MSRSQLELKLIPVSKKLSKKGGYRGHIVNRQEMGYDEVIEEAIRTSHLNFDSIAMKLVVESVFQSMGLIFEMRRAFGLGAAAFWYNCGR